MHEESETITRRQAAGRVAAMAAACTATALLAWWGGFHNTTQLVALTIFVLIISATLLFWTFRLAIAFIGIALLLGAGVISLEEMIWSSELNIILFLVGMMTLVGVLKDLGLFTWIIQLVINVKRMNGMRFVLIVIFMSAIMASLVDEVTSIVFVLALVFQVCDTLKIRPVPFVMIAVMATNIGSSGTMIGNPVGILIGSKGGFAFQDFLVWAAPVMFAALVAATAVLCLMYRREIHELSERLEARRRMELGLGPLAAIPYRRALGILVAAISVIGLHHPLEAWLGVERNTVLMVAPLGISGVLMIWRHKRARHYIEAEVEWWTLLFFMMLFTVAGALEHTGITAEIAHRVQGSSGGNVAVLTPVILVVAALGSAFVDNIIFVAAFIPVVRELAMTPLWWALLFGACFGGNITVIGSTANIVALGMLEKRYHTHIGFREWLRVGAVVGLVTGVVAWLLISLMAPHMPPPPVGAH